MARKVEDSTRAPVPQVVYQRPGARFWLGMVLFQVIFGASIFVLTKAHYQRASAGAPASPARAERTLAAALTASAPTPATAAPAAALASRSTPDLIGEANARFAAQDYAGAAVVYGAIVDKEPSNVDMLNNLAISLHYAGDSVAALARIRRALALDADHQRASLTLGFISRAAGDLTTARTALEKASSVAPGNSVAQEARRLLDALP